MDDINKEVCNYISTYWISKYTSRRKFARDHNINEKIVRKILRPDGYRMPLQTLSTICTAKNISLLVFFFKLNFDEGYIPGPDDLVKK